MLSVCYCIVFFTFVAVIEGNSTDSVARASEKIQAIIAEVSDTSLWFIKIERRGVLFVAEKTQVLVYWSTFSFAHFLSVLNCAMPVKNYIIERDG